MMRTRHPMAGDWTRAGRPARINEKWSAHDRTDTARGLKGRGCQARGGGEATSRATVAGRNVTPTGAATTGVVSATRHDVSKASCIMPVHPTTHGQVPVDMGDVGA